MLLTLCAFPHGCGNSGALMDCKFVDRLFGTIHGVGRQDDVPKAHPGSKREPSASGQIGTSP